MCHKPQHQRIWVARRKGLRVVLPGLFALLAACGNSEPATTTAAPAREEAKELHVYNWSDYIAPDTVSNFEKETGIKVTYGTFDSNEVLETKLLTGHTGYDIVVPSASFLARQIKAGVFLKLDKSQLPHFRNMDPDSLAIVAEFDPGNEHASVWQWGTTGIGYNVQRVRAGLGSAAVGSWSLILDPANASKLQKCGITLLDAPEDVIDAVYIYLGKDLNAENPDDLNAAVAVLMSVRPYIKYFNSSSYIEDLANGGVCVSFGWSGNVFLAKRRAREAREDFDIEYLILSEGAEVWLDTIAIPADAPHPGDAHKFLDYTMRPEVIAAVTNYLSYANGNRASLPLVDAELRSDPNIYPPPEVRSGLVVGKPRSPEYSRLLSRAWTTIKTGR